jgi:hypothetical protein
MLNLLLMKVRFQNALPIEDSLFGDARICDLPASAQEISSYAHGR